MSCLYKETNVLLALFLNYKPEALGFTTFLNQTCSWDSFKLLDAICNARDIVKYHSHFLTHQTLVQHYSVHKKHLNIKQGKFVAVKLILSDILVKKLK